MKNDFTKADPKRFNPTTHAFGASQETRLRASLEAFVGEPITKTLHLYDVMDFESEHYFIELKSRTDKYHPADFHTWLLPSCKAEEAKRNSNKKTLFFYYWAVTDELYLLEYDEPLFNGFYKAVPEWHAEKQEHLYCPAQEFSLIQFTEA